MNELDEQEQIWYDQLIKFINDSGKYPLFINAFIRILDNLITSLLKRIPNK